MKQTTQLRCWLLSGLLFSFGCGSDRIVQFQHEVVKLGGSWRHCEAGPGRGFGVNLDNIEVPDEVIERAVSFPSLYELSLCGSRITDEGINHLSHTQALEYLDLSATQVRDVGLQSLHRISSLRTLRLAHCQLITATGIKQLRSLSKLQELGLEYSAADDEAVAGIAEIAGLRHLHLNGTRVSDRSLRHLATIPSLRSVNLWGTRITDEGLALLSTSSSLETLCLTNCTGITDTGIASLVQCKTIKKLDLNGTSVEDPCVQSLGMMVQLKEVWFGSDTKVSHEAVRTLQNLLPNATIIRLR